MNSRQGSDLICTNKLMNQVLKPDLFRFTWKRPALMEQISLIADRLADSEPKLKYMEQLVRGAQIKRCIGLRVNSSAAILRSVNIHGATLFSR